MPATPVANHARHGLFAPYTTCTGGADEAGRCERGQGQYRLVRKCRR
ncbi:hypothetical protein [Streptomyces sp. CA-106110]